MSSALAQQHFDGVDVSCDKIEEDKYLSVGPIQNRQRRINDMKRLCDMKN